MAEKTIPVAADNSFIRLDGAVMGGCHTIAPSSASPHRLGSSTPFSEGNIGRGTVILDAPTRDPTVCEYVTLGLKIISYHVIQQFERGTKDTLHPFWEVYITTKKELITRMCYFFLQFIATYVMLEYNVPSVVAFG